MSKLDPLYSHYIEFKGWHPGEELQGDTHTYAELMGHTRLSGRLKLLEVGFGEGLFLDWARTQGHDVSGIEILPDAIERAAARGHKVSHEAEQGEFDAIVAIDVLEHLDREGLEWFFDLTDSRLGRDGVVVARFPNGFSPFFGAFQYSDLTHTKPLTSEGLDQAAMPRGFEVISAANPRPIPAGWKRAVRTRLAYAARDLVEIVLGYVYFGCRKPMDPNVVVVLRRRAKAGPLA